MEVKYIEQMGVSPLWEIQGWDLPDADFTPDKPHEHSDGLALTSLRVEMLRPYPEDWTEQWNKNISELNNIVQKTDKLLINQMWKNWWDNFSIPTDNALVINDKDGMNMGYHIDNRAILGVLLINLQDNQDSTIFMDDYKAPTSKGTGFFMLNNNQKHKIIVTKDRLLVYQTLTVSSMFTNNQG